MRTLRFCVVVVALACVSCGGKSPGPGGPASGPWSAPAILAQIPADTPYVIAALEQVDDKTRQHLLDGVNSSVAQLLKTVDKLREGDPATLEPWMRAVLVVADELRGKPPNNWMGELGFHPRGRFAFYGLSVWPVLRIEIANQTKLKSVVERSLQAAGIQLRQGTLDGRNYWVAGTDKIALIAAVLESEAVVAIVPTTTISTALPLVLGTQRPAQSLATTRTIPELQARYRFLGYLLGLFDLRGTVDIVSGRRTGPLDAALHAMTGPVPPACGSDLARLAGVTPRMVFGYHQLDSKGFDGMVVIETAPSVVQAMTKLRSAAPEVTARPAGKPLFSMGVAASPTGFHSWLSGIAKDLRDRPFTCEWLSDLNEAADDLGRVLAEPMPPIVDGLRGFAVTVDNGTILPPTVEGHAVVAGDKIADLVWMATRAPQLSEIKLKPDGQPVALPLSKLIGVPLTGHAALTGDRLVVAAGKASAQRATAHLSTPIPPRSPLFTMTFDVQKLQELLAVTGANEGMESLAYLGYVGMSLDVIDAGLALQAWGTWNDTPQAAAPQ